MNWEKLIRTAYPKKGWVSLRRGEEVSAGNMKERLELDEKWALLVCWRQLLAVIFRQYTIATATLDASIFFKMGAVLLLNYRRTFGQLVLLVRTDDDNIDDWYEWILLRRGCRWSAGIIFVFWKILLRLLLLICLVSFFLYVGCENSHFG